MKPSPEPGRDPVLLVGAIPVHLSGALPAGGFAMWGERDGRRVLLAFGMAGDGKHQVGGYQINLEPEGTRVADVQAGTQVFEALKALPEHKRKPPESA